VTGLLIELIQRTKCDRTVDCVDSKKQNVTGLLIVLIQRTKCDRTADFADSK
jgi:hypothetical protein